MNEVSDEAPAGAPRFEDRLLAEALRHYEDTRQPVQDPRADLRAVMGGGDFERRVLTRSAAVPVAADLRRALERVARTARLVVGALVLLGLLIGAGAANGALIRDRDGFVNFYWAFVGLLGVHTFAMLLWFIAIFVRPGHLPATPLGGLVRAALDWMGRRSKAQSTLRAALDAWMEVMGQRGTGRWALSTLVHLFWSVVLSGVLVALLVLLSARQYDFAWETTILPARVFVSLTAELGRLPARVGFPVPDAETAAASHLARTPTMPQAATRKAWSGLLLGGVLLYGLLPRLLLLLIAAGLLRRAKYGFRLDLDLPGYARLRAHLLPGARRTGVVDHEDAAGEGAGTPRLHRAVRGAAGGVAFAGLEVAVPASGWPPPLARRYRDLGRISDRDAQHAALATLSDLQDPPPALVVVCSLLTSPDRGLGRFLGQLRDAHRGPLVLLLSGSDKVRTRLGADGASERLGDWRRLASTAGIDAGDVISLDLDDVRAVTAFHLEQALPGPDAPRSPAAE